MPVEYITWNATIVKPTENINRQINGIDLKNVPNI